MEKNLEKAYEAFKANALYKVEKTDKYVKVSDVDLWDGLSIYVYLGKDADEDFFEDDELVWTLHLPTEWNSTIQGYQMQEVYELSRDVQEVLNNINEEE